MDWDQTYLRLKRLLGSKLKSISGNSDITVLDVNEGQITIEAKSLSGKAKTVVRKTAELEGIVAKMERGVPIHVDSALHGGGSSRNQPETILANMPDVEVVRIQRRKHIVWVGKDTHKLGTVRERRD